MSNPLINKPNTPDIRGMFNEFKQNPTQTLIKAKFKIPDSVDNNPQSIIQYLLNSGQITQQHVNMAQSRLSWLKQFI